MSDSDSEYIFDSPLTGRIHFNALKVARLIPKFRHVKPDTFNVCVSKKQKSTMGHGRLHTLAEMRYNDRWTMEWINRNKCTNCGEELKCSNCKRPQSMAPYTLIIYPRFFKEGKLGRRKVLVHELYHIKPTLRGIVPHLGFGDEEITKLVRRHFG